MEYSQTLLEALKYEPTEFEVQSECYQYLKQRYPLVRGEIKVQFKRQYKGQRRPRGARYDIVVCDTNSLPLFIIEVKRKESMVSSKLKYYEKLAGVRCYIVGSLKQCISVIDNIDNNLD